MKSPLSERCSWFSTPVQCIVLCAGAGMRMRPRSERVPKVLLEVHGRPLLDYVLSFWRPLVSEFILVVGQRRELVYQYIEERRIDCRVVVQEELRGIAHAASLCEPHIADRFVLQLGDCLTAGAFAWPREMEVGVGVWRTAREADIRQSYSVELDGDGIGRVVEKPRELPNDLCGMGTYFLDRRVFETVRRTPPSALRGEQEITDVLANIIAEGRCLRAVTLSGDYLNVTYPEDLSRAEAIFPPLAEKA